MEHLADGGGNIDTDTRAWTTTSSSTKTEMDRVTRRKSMSMRSRYSACVLFDHPKLACHGMRWRLEGAEMLCLCPAVVMSHAGKVLFSYC